MTSAAPRGFSRAALQGSAEPCSAVALLDSSRAAPRAPGGVHSARRRFQRFELKYWVSEPLAQRVLGFAAPYLRRDQHGATLAAQRNTTLYLDSRGFHFLENHLTLAPDRLKLRIRAYGQPLGSVAFLEVKRKLKTCTVKSRCAVPLSEVEHVLDLRPPAFELAAGDRAAFGDFCFRMHLHRARPQLYVACFREAFESRIPGEDVRLTVDRELAYQPALGAQFDPDPRRWLELREGDDPRRAFGQRPAILELKFDGPAPAWMVELVRCFGLRREAFSKYVTAVMQLRGRT